MLLSAEEGQATYSQQAEPRPISTTKPTFAQRIITLVTQSPAPNIPAWIRPDEPNKPMSSLCVQPSSAALGAMHTGQLDKLRPPREAARYSVQTQLKLALRFRRCLSE